MGMKHKLFVLLVLLNIVGCLWASPGDPWDENYHYREYKSDHYWVRVEPLKDYPCLRGTRNIIRVSVYDMVNNCFYYMHYITDLNWDETYLEYKTNPELKPRRTLYVTWDNRQIWQMTKTNIDQFAADIASAVQDEKDSPRKWYAAVENSYQAYSWTVQDRERIKNDEDNPSK